MIPRHLILAVAAAPVAAGGAQRRQALCYRAAWGLRRP